MACSTSRVSGRFQWTPARSLKPNLSAPWAPFLEPVSFTYASASWPTYSACLRRSLGRRLASLDGNRCRQACDPISGIVASAKTWLTSRLTGQSRTSFRVAAQRKMLRRRSLAGACFSRQIHDGLAQLRGAGDPFGERQAERQVTRGEI